MGEEHASLNPARPDSGTYKGTTQPSLPQGYLSYTSAAALYRSQSLAPYFYWLRGCLFLEQISPPAQICRMTVDEDTSSIHDVLPFHLQKVQCSLLVSHTKADPALQDVAVMHNNLQSPLCLQC